MRSFVNNRASAVDPNHGTPDTELLTLFQQQPEQAWRVFIDRYADSIFSLIRSLGFDYDQSMDRFVFVCEKLCEKNYRRLKAIKYAGSRGELLPWVRQVVKRLCINWAWSEDGRRRLLKPIQQMSPIEQRIFELYFWHGLLPSQIDECLRQEHFAEIEPATVFEALDNIFSKLSEKKLWRLISNHARARRLVSLDSLDDESNVTWEPPDEQPDPEHGLLKREQDQLLQDALTYLPERQVLVLQFHFEHGLSPREIGGMLRLDEAEVKNLVKTGIERLRRCIEK
jgi:RNA polymerase sigma factor (sigma-70 family)